MNVFNCYMVDKYKKVKIVLGKYISKTKLEEIEKQVKNVVDNELRFISYPASKDPYIDEVKMWR